MNPRPVTIFVLEPIEGTVKVTRLVKLPAPGGAKLIRRFVEPNPGKLNGDPETMLKIVPLALAVPFVSGAPPTFVKTKLN